MIWIRSIKSQLHFPHAWLKIWQTNVMSLGTQHAAHFVHLQFTPSCASKRLKDVCGNCPVFCICPSHMSHFDWLQRGEWHQSGAGDRAVLIALWGFAFESFLLISVLSGYNSKQVWDEPAEPEKGARLEESQQEADRSYLFFFLFVCFVCLTHFVWTLVDWLCLFDENIRNIISNQVNKTNKSFPIIEIPRIDLLFMSLYKKIIRLTIARWPDTGTHNMC